MSGIVMIKQDGTQRWYDERGVLRMEIGTFPPSLWVEPEPPMQGPQHPLLEYADRATSADFAALGSFRWESYVPDEVQAVWGSLDLLAKCAIVASCEKMAAADMDRGPEWFT